MKQYFTIIGIIICSVIYCQTTTNESLALEYYKKGDFEKAVQIYENIYKDKKVKSIYNRYVDCLIKTQSYKKAEKIIRNFYRKSNDLTVLIDWGQLYTIQNKDELANEKFQLAIKEGEENTRFLASIGGKFLKNKQYELALQAYTLAKAENNKASYSIQIANIYSYKGEIENMYQELIDLLYIYPNYFQTCKNKLRVTIGEDDENDNNKKLKKILIKNIQKDNSYEVSKLLVWLFMQEKKFQDALDYEITIDKRISDNLIDIISLGDIAFSNKDFETAVNAFHYILEKSAKNSYSYEYSSLQLLDIKFEKLKSEKIKKNSEIKNLASEYKSTLDYLGIKSETIFTFTNYCDLLSKHLGQEKKAIELLEHAINNIILEAYDLAICKMELANILVRQDQLWDATLMFAQVEKDFKEDLIGQKAKFEKTKISYYNGDFEWAQTQLKALKLSTSKLIANNAMKLSLLISDNLNLDTTDTALLLYAKSELLFEQKQYEECLNTLNILESSFPNHSLSDELLMKKTDVFIEKKEYDQALITLKKICEKYYYDILYDDALFYQAEIYEKILLDNDTAKEKYEELLLKNSNSIFISQARKKYRLLRKNNFLELK
ncbi:MAG: hypothetical protein CMD26_00750 [Flavobacteriales bacterium]|nr:hypothetical protein [Flavobacteriales bacterium]|tara:strand:+ start:2235 stop:4052 length:1818 start_codon:yes stop_codon:yes gene_type:complete